MMSMQQYLPQVVPRHCALLSRALAGWSNANGRWRGAGHTKAKLVRCEQARRPHCHGDNSRESSHYCLRMRSSLPATAVGVCVVRRARSPPSSAPLIVFQQPDTMPLRRCCSAHREQLSGAGGGEPCYQSFFQVCRWRAPVCLHMAPINFPSPSSPLGDNHSRAHVPPPLVIPVCTHPRQPPRTFPRRRRRYLNG